MLRLLVHCQALGGIRFHRGRIQYFIYCRIRIFRKVVVRSGMEKQIQEILRVPIIGVIPESEEVLQASNQGSPVIHQKETDAAEAYHDVVSRFLGEDQPLRFVDYVKPSLLKRIFGGK